MIHRFFLVSILLVLAGPTAAWSQQAHTVMESEPNDTPASANPAALGDILTGSISSNSDVDFFVLDIPAGTLVLMATLLQVCFFDQDGTTLLTCNSGEYNEVGYPFTKSGRYYIRLRHGTPETGVTPMGPYQMVVPAESFSLEAGDPARRLVDLPEIDFHGLYPNYEIWRMAAGLAGELYVTVVNGVLRISPTGDTTTLASDLHVIGDVAVDAFGDVVVAGWRDSPFGLWKISPAGELSQYRTDVVFSQFDVPSLAVGPDGDLWVGTNAGITRLDPNGVKKAEIALTAAYHLVVGPSGELYVTGAPGPCEWGAYVVRGLNVECTLPNLTEMVGHATPELAIDQEGALYVGQHEEFGWGYGPRGHVDVLPTGSKTSHQYAHVPWLRALTFGRDTQGNTTSRLFAIQGGVPPWVVELNGANDRAVGAGFNVRFYHATIDSLPLATFGLSYVQALRISTDSTEHTWSVENGTLPPGLTLSTDGVLKGVPTALGSYEFTVRATSGLRSWFAPGTISVRGDPIDVSQIVAALLGGPALSPTQVQLLDQIGNKNGILDTGDLRAYLRSMGELTPH